MIGRMTRAGEMKKRLSLGARVAVDQHHLPAAFARLAAKDAALAARTKARVIGPGTVDLRRLAIILFEARAHFSLEFFLQAEGRRHDRVGVGVLRLQESADVWRQSTGVAQHLAPVVRAYPAVLIRPGDAVRRVHDRPYLSPGRRGDRGLRARPARHSLARHGARTPAARESARKAGGTSAGDSQRYAAPAARSSSAPP